MADKTRKTGLGLKALFTETLAQEQAETPQATKQDVDTAGEKKVRTTLSLYAKDFALLEDLKIFERRRGNKATYSDLIAEALQLLAEHKGVHS